LFMRLAYVTLTMVTLWATQAASDVQGRPRVVDGDTLDFGTSGAHSYVRLEGIDAPESKQECGTADGKLWACGKGATAALKRATDGKAVVCVGNDIDRYGRLIAFCFAAGVDVGQFMVAGGWAEAYVKYTKVYAKAEKIARKAGLGIWQGPHISPAAWRAGVRP
jgi:endonuclease YncB( thermonuclease family)